MRIGIDFDNTIVSYDELFHQVAREKNLIPADLPVNKVAVRNHLRSINQEDKWTLMQGEVYGLRMSEARAYDGMKGTIAAFKLTGHQVFIISHKTRHPFMGPAYDLHQSARNWVDLHLVIDGTRLFEREAIFYELTKEEKIARALALDCDLFIDDLPEILAMDGFPVNMRKILFDPEGQHEAYSDSFERVSAWQAIGHLVLR